MRSARIALSLILLLALTGCWNPLSSLFKNPFSGGGDDDTDRPAVVPSRVADPAEKLAVAIGGVASGRDELIITDDNGDPRDFGGSVLDCSAEGNIVHLSERPGYESQAAGSGVLITAVSPGVVAIECTVDGADLGKVYEVTVPPQSLIQILVAEAATQLTDDAQIDTDLGDDVVSLESVSPTGDALGVVIRNRIERINAENKPELFSAIAEDYDREPPASYYDAVIEAPGQFAPTDPDDPAHATYDDAQDRNFLDAETRVAYDQAVLTAAAVFNGDTDDPTGGAFAFLSPNDTQWDAISQAFTIASWEILPDSGFSDANFPSLAPIQILIIPDVWKYDDGRPSFVFARRRTSEAPAVTNVPYY